MGYADLPELTEAAKILAALDILSARQQAFADAVNGLGQNVQWIIDTVQPFLSALPAVMPMLTGMPGIMNTEDDSNA